MVRRAAPARRTGILLLAALLAAGWLLVRPATPVGPLVAAAECARHYVATGDHIPAGHEVEEAERYPNQLLSEHLEPVGPWCLYPFAVDEATSTEYITEGQVSGAWNRAADLITITIGGENPSIVDLVTDCFDKVKDHDFLGASACAGAVYANQGAFDTIKRDLTTILGYYRVLAARRPNLVVAITTYPNPYPSSTKALTSIPQLCLPLIDTIVTCTIRWMQLPPALVLLDRTIGRLNQTITDAVKPFQLAANGQRFVVVDGYTKLRDHCMKMEVEIKTKVEHPEQNGAVHDHNSPKVNFGCSDPWFVEGDDGTKEPTYLIPATLGVLIQQSQTTSGMGTHPDEDGQDCLSDLIFEADTIEPGVTPLKWKLGIAEAAQDPCT